MNKAICTALEVRLYLGGILYGVVNDVSYPDLLIAMERWCAKEHKKKLHIAVLWDKKKNCERRRLLGFPEEVANDGGC